MANADLMEYKSVPPPPPDDSKGRRIGLLIAGLELQILRLETRVKALENK